jgi:hypothetical protein
LPGAKIVGTGSKYALFSPYFGQNNESLFSFEEIFDDSFIDYLFDIVEQTRHMQDETFNYSVIKFIVRTVPYLLFRFLTISQVSLNEQFMVASLSPDASNLQSPSSDAQLPESKNRIIRVLMRRLGSSKTFGENMIFMLNRAG